MTAGGGDAGVKWWWSPWPEVKWPVDGLAQSKTEQGVEQCS